MNEKHPRKCFGIAWVMSMYGMLSQLFVETFVHAFSE